MVASYYSGSKPTTTQIQAIDDWMLTRFGYALNNYNGSEPTGFDMAILAREYFGLNNAARYSHWTLLQLQQELSNGYPVIVGVYTSMKPAYGYKHFMVLVGMDANTVYVNDPGRTSGQQKAYPLSDFQAAWKANANNAVVAVHSNGPPPSAGSLFNQPDFSATSIPSWYGDNWYQLGTGFSGTLQALTVKCFTSGGNFGSSRGTLTLNEFSDSAYSVLTNSYSLPSTCGPALADVTSANLNITLLPTRYYRLDTLDSLQNASVRLLGTNSTGVAMYDSFVPGVGGVQTHYTFYPYIISNAPPSPPPSCPSAPTAPNGVAYFPFREVFGSGLTINSLGLWTSSDGGVYCCSQSYVTLLSDVQGNPGPPIATSSIITLGYRAPASENVYSFPSPVQIAAGTAFWISFNTGPSTTTNETQVYGTNGTPFLDFIGFCGK
jgi:hypothetical protein